MRKPCVSSERYSAGTPAGKAITSRNAYKGGHWLMLRELSHMVNAEIREERDLVERVRQ